MDRGRTYHYTVWNVLLLAYMTRSACSWTRLDFQYETCAPVCTTVYEKKKKKQIDNDDSVNRVPRRPRKREIFPKLCTWRGQRRYHVLTRFDRRSCGSGNPKNSRENARWSRRISSSSSSYVQTDVMKYNRYTTAFGNDRKYQYNIITTRLAENIHGHGTARNMVKKKTKM